MNAKLKRAVVTDTKLIQSEYDHSFTFAELQAVCLNAINSLPKQYMDSAKFSVKRNETWHQYESSSSTTCDLVMSYCRPETDEELAKRQKITDAFDIEQEKHEFAEFVRLNAKFGKS